MKLEVRNLNYAYGEREILRDVSFSVRKGDFCAVLGANGVGKTTLFKCILGILRDYRGKIRSDGTDLRTLSAREMARLIAYIPQVNHPTFGYSVLDTVLMGAAGQGSAFAQPGKKQYAAAYAALERIGIADFAARSFFHLSGGEQQLVLVARALAQDSQILIMDEPTASLDFGNQFRALEKVHALTEEGYTVLLSTHNPQHALSFSNCLLALKDGSVAAFGDTKTELTAELIERLYSIRARMVGCGGVSAVIPIV